MIVQLRNLMRLESEEEKVLFPDGIENFDIGTVIGSDGHRTVHHELHVAGTGSFLPCCRDLFGEIRSRRDDLHAADTVVWQKCDFQFIAHIWVIVYHLGNIIDQLDDRLGAQIARCRLTPDQNATIRPSFRVTALDAAIEINNVQDIQ